MAHRVEEPLECKNGSGHKNLLNGGVSYHRFPKNAATKEAWIKATGRTNWMPVKSCTVCSEHFSENNFLLTKKGYRYLKTNAIPNKKVMFYCEKYQNITRTQEPSGITITERIPKLSTKDSELVTPERKSQLPEQDVLVASDASETPTKDVDAELTPPKIKTRVLYVSAAACVQEKSDGHSERISCVYSPPRKQKLQGQLRWALEKIKSKNLKIKTLQTQNRRLKKKLKAQLEKKL